MTVRVKILESGFETEIPTYTGFLMVLKGVATFIAESPEEQRAIDAVMELMPKPPEYWLDNVPENLEQIVMDKFKEQNRISSDDCYYEIMSKAKGRDPRIVGSVFQSLKKKGLIKPVGNKPTEKQGGHGRRIVIWEKSVVDRR